MMLAQSRSKFITCTQIPSASELIFLEQWKAILHESFPFIDNIFLFPFNTQINYNFATGKEILDDDLNTEILEFIKKSLDPS